MTAAMLLDLAAVVFLLAGCGFYFAGTVGLLRFPDTHCRLHALTKADNVGLMMVCIALALHAAHWRVPFLLAMIWLFGLLASSISAHLLARRAARSAELVE